MGFARAADVPVVLIGDIDRGGVIASLVGTKAVHRAGGRRADPRLHRQQIPRRSGTCLPTGMERIAQADRLAGARSGAVFCRCATAAGGGRAGARAERPVKAQAVACASPCRSCRISPISTISIRSRPSPAVDLVRVRPGTALPGDADLVLLPGSKATIADLAALRAAGFDIDIAAHRAARRQRCSGFAAAIRCWAARLPIPDGIEGPPGRVEGLGLLDVETTLSDEKRLEPVRGDNRRRRAVLRLRNAYRASPKARIARGRLRGSPTARRKARFPPTAESSGTYVHGLFADDRQRAAWLARFCGRRQRMWPTKRMVERTLDALADHLAAHIDIDRLLRAAR